MDKTERVIWPSVVYCDKEERLIYSDNQCKRIPKELIERYAGQIRYLDLSYNKIKSTEGLQKFVNLEELVLDNNEINDTFLIWPMKKLHTLSLNKNKISNLELTIRKIVHNLPALRYLSLLGNVACPNQLSDKEKDDEDYERYRQFVLHYLLNLQFLDSRTVTNREREEAKTRGQFMRVIRPSTVDNNVVEFLKVESLYTPLPITKRSSNDHKGAYGKCVYKYTGANSEGNRFIMNHDL